MWNYLLAIQNMVGCQMFQIVLKLHRRSYPDNSTGDLQMMEQALSFYQMDTIPSYEDMVQLGLANPEDVTLDEYWEACSQTDFSYYASDCAGSLLGYALPIQASMLPADRPDGDILLMQLFPEDTDELQLGDCGKIYFYITRQDLQQRNFSNVRCEVQSY